MATRDGFGVEELSCREVVEIHLADCGGCAAYLEQLRTMIRLGGRLPEEAVVPEMMAPLLEAFRAWRRGLSGDARQGDLLRHGLLQPGRQHP